MRRPSPLGLALTLTLAATSGCATVHRGPALTPFATDGCSLFPDGTRDSPDLWCDCCLAHDLAYWKGGTAAERLAADTALQACVLERTQDPHLARTVFLGVRAGGAAVFRSTFRWGYGWAYGRGYRSLTEAERAEVAAALDAYVRRNPALRCGAEPPPS
jgi:hypothetical protein